MDLDFYVYALVDPRTDQPFYVGKGKGQRASQHLYPGAAKSSRNLFRLNVIKKLKSEGLSPKLVFVHTGLSEAQASELERQEIIKYGRKRFDQGGILTNLALGGGGTE